MNKNSLLIAIAVALSLSWVGCNKSGKLNEPSTFKPPTGPIELKLKWPEGERIIQTMDMKINTEINIPNQPQPMKQDMGMGQDYSMTVIKAEPDGRHVVEMEFLGARMKMAMGGKNSIDFDSAKSKSSDKTDPMTDVYKKFIGAKIRYFLDASNNVERLEGIDDLLKRVSSGSAAAAPFKSMFSEDFFKQMMSQNRYLPSKPVQPGDTWPVLIEMPMGPIGTLVMDYTFTFQRWETHGTRNCARMDFEGTIKSKPGAKSSKESVTFSGLDGTTTGTSWFDPEFGTIIDNRLKQDMTMVMTVNMGSMQSMTNHMIQDMTIKVVSVK